MQCLLHFAFIVIVLSDKKYIIFDFAFKSGQLVPTFSTKIGFIDHRNIVGVLRKTIEDMINYIQRRELFMLW